MHRRLVVLTTAAAMVAGAGSLLAAHAADPLPADYPAAGCFTYSDPTGDASFGGEAPNDPDLDITGFALETTDTSLRAYVKVDGLTSSGPQFADGHRYTLKFTFNKHVFSAAGSDYANGSGPIRDGLAQTGHAGHVTQLGVDTPAINPTNPDPAILTSPGYVDSGLKVTFDYTNGYVNFELPIADIEKYGGASFTGDLTDVVVQSQTDEYAIGSVWDSAPDLDANGDPAGKWTVGDNACFGPAPAVVTNLGATKVQYGDTAAVSAKVTDASGAPVANAPVTFTIGKLLTTSTTNSKGVASAKLTPTVTAGSYSLVETFAGSDTAGKASARTPFSVVAEKSVLALSEKTSGTKRIVTATLRDDDHHALAEQVVAWSVNGKAAGKVTTSSTGTARFTAKPGQTVKAVFAAVTGKYTGASASRKA
jgi:hypothetical protein